MHGLFFKAFMAAVVVAAGPAVAAEGAPGKPAAPEPAAKIQLEGEYTGHLQDVWFDKAEKVVYWAHTTALVKTDMNGKILTKADVPYHHAGIELSDERLFVAVCPMKNLPGWIPEKEWRVWVWEYDPKTLALVKKHELAQNDRAGSLAKLPDGDWLVGCLRGSGLAPTQVRAHRYSADFSEYRGPVVWDLPKAVQMGIETIHFCNGVAYLSIYGSPMLKLDKDLKIESELKLDGTVGWFVADDKMWVAYTKNVKKPEDKDVLWKNGRWHSGFKAVSSSLAAPVVRRAPGERPLQNQ